MLAQIAV